MSVFTLPTDTLERLRDLLVAELLEMEQHQRHALMIGEIADRLFETLAAIRGLQPERAGHLRLERALEGRVRTRRVQLAEELSSGRGSATGG